MKDYRGSEVEADKAMFDKLFAEIARKGVEGVRDEMKRKYDRFLVCDMEKPVTPVDREPYDGFFPFTVGGFEQVMYVYSVEDGCMHTARLGHIAGDIWENVVRNAVEDGIPEDEIDDTLLSRIYSAIWVYPRDVSGVFARGIEKEPDQYGFHATCLVAVAGDEPCSEPTPRLGEEIELSSGFRTAEEFSSLVDEFLDKVKAWS